MAEKLSVQLEAKTRLLFDKTDPEIDINQLFSFTEQCFSKYIEVQDPKSAACLRLILQAYHALQLQAVKKSSSKNQKAVKNNIISSSKEGSHRGKQQAKHNKTSPDIAADQLLEQKYQL